MNRSYLCYNPDTGEIVETGGCPHVNGQFLHPVPEGTIMVENTWGAQSGSHYWDQFARRPVPMSDLSASITRTDRPGGVDFTGIPVGTRVVTYGVGLRTEVVVNDGTLEYDAETPGTHYFSFFHPRYAQWEDVTLEVE